jgi:hypothetical protein
MPTFGASQFGGGLGEPNWGNQNRVKFLYIREPVVGNQSTIYLWCIYFLPSMMVLLSANARLQAHQ